MSNINYINTCACVEAIDRIVCKTFLRLSREFRICFLKRELIPSIIFWGLKSIIGSIETLRENNEMAVYINMYDLVTFGLVELNFEDTEKATNILPDFRLGKRGCEYAGVSYEKYISKQVPIENYKGRIVNIECRNPNNNAWKEMLYNANLSIYSYTEFNMDDFRLLDTILEVFLEEMFYDLGEHKEEGYVYKLFDILYFNYIKEEDMWGTDVMPEYKLIVKNDVYSENLVEKAINDIQKTREEQEMKKGLYW